MKKCRLVILLTIFIAFSFSGVIMSGCGIKQEITDIKSGVDAKEDVADELDKYMTAYNSNSNYKYSGTILAAKGDKILLNKGYGMANYEEKIPNEPDTIFAIGSITKSFTAIAIMQLQEKGLLNVDDPISKYITGNKRGDDITIHHLLTHTSGLVRDGYIEGVSKEKNIDFINKQSLMFEPGQNYSYSNAGYEMLAAIIEKVSGRSYNDYIRENIFILLGMDKSRGGIDDSYAEDQAVGYQISTREPARLKIYSFLCIAGTGNIYSTAGDLYKYDRALYGEKLLSEASLNKIFSPHWGNMSSGYGYGWEISEMYGHKKISHGGNIGGGGYNSLIIRFPDDDCVLIFLTNNADKTALNEVSGTMSSIVLGKEYVMPGKISTVEVSSKILKKYAGNYDFGKGMGGIISYSDGRLYSKFGDGASYGLIPISKTEFYPENYENIRVIFILGKDNSVTGIKIIENGIVYEAKKVD